MSRAGPAASIVEEPASRALAGVPGRVVRIRQWIRTHPGMVVLLVLPILLFGLPTLFGWTFMDGDNFLQNFPLRVLVGRDLRQGVLPLWNPYLFGGTPLLAGFNAGAAYPVTWLMVVLPIFTAWWASMALAYDVAAAGTYLFLRRQGVASTAATFGAATFTFAGYMTAQIVHIDLITSASWLPWMLMAVHALTTPPGDPGPAAPAGAPAGARRRAWVAVLALALGLDILSGGAEAIIDGAVLVAIYTVGRVISGRLLARPNRRAMAGSIGALAAGVAGGLAFGAAQWISGAAFIGQSQRAAVSYAFFTSGSLPDRLVTLLASPFVLGTNQGHPGTYAGPYNFPEVTSYVGVLALIAVVSLPLRRYRSRPEAREWWVWYAVAGVGLLSALGGDTPFGRVLFGIPVIADQRLLSRNILLVDFALAVLLGWWVHLLVTGGSGGTARHAAAPSTRQRVRRVEVIVTCLPAAFIVAVCLFLWIDGSRLEHLLSVQLPIGPETREQEAALVTGGALVALAATAIVLRSGRLARQKLVRLLGGVLAADLVLFNCFVVRLPTSEAKAQAIGPASAALRKLTGNGRFIIYDPDEFEPEQLYALGQTDLNIHTRIPSGQGYTALNSGKYVTATGARYQEDLDPADLTGSSWDDLNVTTLLSLPGYFVTPVHPSAPSSVRFPYPLRETEFKVAPPPSNAVLIPGRVQTWYFGGVLTVSSLEIPVDSGPAGRLRVGLLTPAGRLTWLPADEVHTVSSGGRRSEQITLGAPTASGGVVVETAGGPKVVVGFPTVRTAEAGEVALDGRMQGDVGPPHWVFIGTLGSFGVFRNQRARGWAWVSAPSGATTGGTSTVGAGPPGLDGHQQITVRTTTAAVLERSEAWSSGWRASIEPLGPAGGGAAPVRTVTVARSGVIQQVALPGPGDYRVSFTYAATSALVAVAVSAAAAVILVVWGAAELVARRRRGRAAIPDRARSP